MLVKCISILNIALTEGTPAHKRTLTDENVTSVNWLVRWYQNDEHIDGRYTLTSHFSKQIAVRTR